MRTEEAPRHRLETLIATIATVAIACLLAAADNSAGSDALPHSTGNRTQASGANDSKASQSQKERISYLEELGHLPDGASAADQVLAQFTSWWGRPLDPKTFWSNRVVWLDRSALNQANWSGRRYPPIPDHDYTSEMQSYHSRRHLAFITPNDPGPHFVDSQADARYWNDFAKSHPAPPCDFYWLHEMAYRGLNVTDYNFPPESLSTNAVFWGHLEARRNEYQGYTSAGGNGAMFDFDLPKELIIEPLTPEQEVAMHAWKYDYVARLKREKCNAVYINAYIEQWGLSNASEWERSAAQATK